MKDLTNPLIAEYIGPYYVYLLIDRALNEVYYVGKGTGWRFADHLNDFDTQINAILIKLGP